MRRLVSAKVKIKVNLDIKLAVLNEESLLKNIAYKGILDAPQCGYPDVAGSGLGTPTRLTER